MKPLTLKQKEILDFIKDFFSKHEYSPSLEEIADAFGLSAVSTVHKHLSLLQKKGYLKKASNIARGIKTPEANEKTSQIPLLGKIAAGLPIEAIEYPDFIEIPSSMLKKNKNYFALKVTGDSMIEDGILDGDIILIRQQITANINEIIVASTNNEATLKRFGGVKNGKVKLIPKNPKMKPYLVSAENFEIKGIFSGLIRRIY